MSNTIDKQQFLKWLDLKLQMYYYNIQVSYALANVVQEIQSGRFDSPMKEQRDRVMGEWEASMDTTEEVLQMLSDSQSEVQRLRAALEFYAKKNHLSMHYGEDGEVARQALSTKQQPGSWTHDCPSVVDHYGRQVVDKGKPCPLCGLEEQKDG